MEKIYGGDKRLDKEKSIQDVERIPGITWPQDLQFYRRRCLELAGEVRTK